MNQFKVYLYNMKKLFISLILLSNILVADNLNVLFASNSYKINHSEIKKIDTFIDYLFTNPDLSTILEGHADSISTYKYNQELSIKRVTQVKKYMLMQGILDSRITIIGYGEKKPLVSNMLKNGRQINRRVTAKIIK